MAINIALFKAHASASILGYTIMKIRTVSSATFVQTSITKVTAAARNTEHAFMSNGFLNWKKTLLTFKDHQTSESRNLLLSVRLFSKKTNLSNSNAQNIRTQNHHCLAKIIKTLQYLVRRKCRGKCYDGASTMFGKKNWSCNNNPRRAIQNVIQHTVTVIP